MTLARGAVHPRHPDEETEARRSHGNWGRSLLIPQGVASRLLHPGPPSLAEQGARGRKREGNDPGGRSVPGRGCRAVAGRAEPGRGLETLLKPSETPALTPPAGSLAASPPLIDLGSSGSHRWLHRLPGTILLSPLGLAQPGCGREAPTMGEGGTPKASRVLRSPLSDERPWALSPGEGPCGLVGIAGPALSRQESLWT